MEWFVDSDIAKGAINNGDLINEEDVEVDPNKIAASCLDENVCLSQCKKYFTEDSWLVVESVVAVMRSNPTDAATVQ